MTKFAKGIEALFTGGDTSAQTAEIKRQRETQEIALAREQGALQQQEAEADVASGRAARIPKGRRLLLAATGEAGVASTLNG